MIRKQEIAAVGSFQKTHGLKGELNALLDIDPDYFADGHPLVLDMDGIYVPFYAESVRPKGNVSCLLQIEGVDTVEKARTFVNKEIFAIAEQLKEYFDIDDEELMQADELEGYDVVDGTFGKIGRVAGIEDSTANELLIVASDANPEHEIMIPLVDDFVRGIDRESRTINVDVPESLLDLNRPD